MTLFADPAIRERGFRMAATRSGAESDSAGGFRMPQRLLADATFTGQSNREEAWPDQGYRIESPRVFERRTIFAPAGVLAASAPAIGHNFFSLDPDGPIRHTVPFVRTGDRAMPSLGLAAALVSRDQTR
jgi:hypothetical protein